MRLVRVSQLRSLATFALLIGLIGCGSSHQVDYTPQFDELWETFDKNYIFFEYKHIDWQAANATYLPRAAAARSEDDLIAVLKDMLGILHDRHVGLQSTSGQQFPTFEPHYFVNRNTDVWMQYISRSGWVQDKFNLGHATFNGVPYIAIGQWSPQQMSIDDLDAVLELFRNSSGLIVDVRVNGGGDLALATQFAGRFTTTSRTLAQFQYRDGPGHTDVTDLQPWTVEPRGSWQFTKPVLVLLGRASVSTTEAFAAGMREFPNVTLVGDTTFGAAGHPVVHQLTTEWSYTVPDAALYTAERQAIEDQGIAPTVSVAVTDTDFNQGRDPVLDWAIAHLSATP